MNFDLKTLGLPAAAAEKCDLLVLLVPDGFKPSDDVLSTLVAQAVKQGDFETKAGKSLALYQTLGVAARRVLLLGVGAGDGRGVRQALQAANGALRGANIKRAVVCFAGTVTPQNVSAAVLAVVCAKVFWA